MHDVVLQAVDEEGLGLLDRIAGDLLEQLHLGLFELIDLILLGVDRGDLLVEGVRLFVERVRFAVEGLLLLLEAALLLLQLRAAFPNPNGLLHSGGAGNIILPYVRKQCVVIPQAATFELQDKVYVYKVVDGKATSAAIAVDRISNGREYIVNSGLVPGDVIVAEGVGLMREGTPVQPKARRPPPPPPTRQPLNPKPQRRNRP